MASTDRHKFNALTLAYIQACTLMHTTIHICTNKTREGKKMMSNMKGSGNYFRVFEVYCYCSVGGWNRSFTLVNSSMETE